MLCPLLDIKIQSSNLMASFAVGKKICPSRVNLQYKMKSKEDEAQNCIIKWKWERRGDVYRK